MVAAQLAGQDYTAHNGYIGGGVQEVIDKQGDQITNAMTLLNLVLEKVGDFPKNSAEHLDKICHGLQVWINNSHSDKVCDRNRPSLKTTLEWRAKAVFL